MKRFSIQSIGIIIFTFLLWWPITLRDKWGPNSISTDGIVALSEILSKSWIYLITGFVVLVLSIYINIRLRQTKSDR